MAASLQCRSKGLQIHANTDGAADLAVSPTGGILGTGGIADGGAVGSGGINGTSGALGTGGISAAGGLVGTRGVIGTGGRSGTGGLVGSGGRTASGGASGPGGATSTGIAGSTGVCDTQLVSSTRQPTDMLLVLDRSSSMDFSMPSDCYCTALADGGTVCADTTNCTTRWQGVSAAVTSALSSSTGLNWGLKLFSTPGAAQCAVSSTVEVPIGANTAPAISAIIQSATFSNGTPTAAALNAATAYLRTLDDSSPRFILLVTDGSPTCGGTPPSVSGDDLPGSTSAATAAYAAGFPVYVIGMGPTPIMLTRLAGSGGTTDYYLASSPQQMVDAFGSIGKRAASCTFELSTRPTDASSIGIYLDKTLVPKDDANGWTFGASTQTIVLKGAACDKVTSGQASTVQAFFACGYPPPLTIP